MRNVQARSFINQPDDRAISSHHLSQLAAEPLRERCADRIHPGTTRCAHFGALQFTPNAELALLEKAARLGGGGGGVFWAPLMTDGTWAPDGRRHRLRSAEQFTIVGGAVGSAATVGPVPAALRGTALSENGSAAVTERGGADHGAGAASR